jgi:hypothetical protein
MWRILGSLVIVLFLLGSCKTEDYSDEVSFISDLETVKGDKFKSSSSIELSGASYQSDKKARSGRYSVRLDSSDTKVLKGEISNIKIGDEIYVSVWRYAPGKNKGQLYVKVGHMNVFKTSKAVKKEGDWELLETTVMMPNEFKGHKLIWYVNSLANDEVFFDDLEVKLKRNKGLQISEHPSLPKINIELSDEDIDKLEAKRLSAIENGVLISSSDDWIKTKISWNGDKKKAKIRLKGDWTDHLYGEKFSIRVNVSKDKTLNDYSKFAIQNPVSRHFIDEWFVHQILHDEDILTTRYEFADLYINDESKGLYAIEEHFTPELLISQGRKVGPIFKFSEDDLWYSRYINDRKDIRGVPWYPGSVIEVFSQDEIVEQPELLNDFYRGRELMYRYKFKEGKASEIVDVKKMAANFAMMDLSAGYHSIIWHNQRFYYNDQDDVLEPLVYDIFQESSRLKKEPMDFLGLQYVRKPKSYQVTTSDFLFQDSAFVDWYTYYLEKYSTEGYFDSVQNVLKDDLALFESEIQKEYDFYSFDLEFYQKRAAAIRANLAEFKDGMKERLAEDLKPKYGVYKSDYDFEPIKNVSLHAYLNFVPGKTELQVQNFYFKPITIVGVLANKRTVLWDDPIKLPPYLSTRSPQTTIIDISIIPESVIFNYEGNDSLFTQKIQRYRVPIDSYNGKEED